MVDEITQIENNIWLLATNLRDENLRLRTENEILKRLVDGWVAKFEEILGQTSRSKNFSETIGYSENKVIKVKMSPPSQQPSQQTSQQPSQQTSQQTSQQPSQQPSQQQHVQIQLKDENGQTKTLEQIKREKQREAVRKCREKKRLAKELSEKSN